MSNNILHIAQIFDSQSLVTRQAARELAKIVSEISDSRVILDFSSIDFASRSFFDELNNFQNEVKASKKIEIRNLNSNLTSLLDLIKASSKIRSVSSQSNISNATTLSF